VSFAEILVTRYYCNIITIAIMRLLHM